MADLERKVKTGCAHAGITEAEVAKNLGTSPQNFSRKVRTLYKKADEIEALASAMGAELKMEIIFPDGFKV